MATRERVVLFIFRLWPLLVAHVSVDDPTPMHIHATQIGSVEHTCVLKITGNQEGGVLGSPREK